MLTLGEVLDDAAALPDFRELAIVGVKSRGTSGQTPLHWMATLGDVSAVDLLVAAGAEIDAQDVNGNTPLHHATMARQSHAALRLIEHGAQVGIRNHGGQTPRDLAIADEFPPTLEVLRHAG